MVSNFLLQQLITCLVQLMDLRFLGLGLLFYLLQLHYHVPFLLFIIIMVMKFPKFGSFFAIDCLELFLLAEVDNVINIMRHGVGIEFHGKLLSFVIKCICLVMVALTLFKQKKTHNFYILIYSWR
jgi:hypothetical protein